MMRSHWILLRFLAVVLSTSSLLNAVYADLGDRFQEMAPCEQISYLFQVESKRHSQRLNSPSDESVWHATFQIQAPTNSASWGVFFTDMKRLSRLVLNDYASLTNEASFMQLADHFRAFEPVNSQALMVEAKIAFETDKRLNTTNQTTRVNTGMRGVVGPNMRKWHTRHRRAQCWNSHVADYRAHVLFDLHAQLDRMKANGCELPFGMLQRFAKRANLTKDEAKSLGIMEDVNGRGNPPWEI